MEPANSASGVVGSLGHTLSVANIDWLSVAFGVIGVIGAVYGYLAWREGEKQKKLHAYLFELAERNIDKSVTEQQLAERRKAIDEASARIEALQEQIRLDIPKAAKRAVLSDRLKSQLEILHQHYSSVVRLRDELVAIGAPVDIPSELLHAIEKEIEPEYMVRERRSRLKTTLSVLTTGAAISAATLPYPFERIFSVTLLLLAVPVVLALVLLALKERKKSDPANVPRLAAAGILIAAALTLGLAAFALLLAFVEPRSWEITLPIGGILSVGGATMLFVGVRRWQRVANLTKKPSLPVPDRDRAGERPEAQ